MSLQADPGRLVAVNYTRTNLVQILTAVKTDVAAMVEEPQNPKNKCRALFRLTSRTAAYTVALHMRGHNRRTDSLEGLSRHRRLYKVCQGASLRERTRNTSTAERFALSASGMKGSIRSPLYKYHGERRKLWVSY